MCRSVHAAILILASSLAYGGSSWPMSDGGTIKIINPAGATLTNGCYLNQKLVSLKTRTYVEPSEWVAYLFPLPNEFAVTKTKEGYEFSSAPNVSITPAHFLFNFEVSEKNGTYEGFVCVKDFKWGDKPIVKGCITQIDIQSKDMFTVKYGETAASFVNVDGMASEKSKSELGPCQWP